MAKPRVDKLVKGNLVLHAHPIEDLDATGTPSSSTFLRGDGTWDTPSGSGDMTAAVYDPQNIADDAFDQDNMTDGTINKNYTATEKTKLAGIADGATVYTDEMAQDAVGNNVGNGLDYDDTTGAVSVDETELTHNSLGSKQGGTTGEYYHLTAAQATVVANTSGTNTGDQTLPVKASGAELDTGTDDAKFATAKAIKDSHNVPSVAPSTAGKLMRSDGADWTSASVTTADIAASTDKNYVTDAQAVVIGNTSGTNTGDQDLSSLAPKDPQYVTLATNATLTNERVLTGTSNQVTVTDNGAGSTVVLSTPQDIATSSSPTFTDLTLSGGLGVGATNTVAGTVVAKATSNAAVANVFQNLDSGSSANVIFQFLNDTGGGVQFQTFSSTFSGVGFGNVANGAKLRLTSSMSGGFVLVTAHASAPFILGTSDLERVRIDPTGKVGVGTSSPVTLFHVNGIGSFGDSVTTGNSFRALNLASTSATMRVLRVVSNFGTQSPAFEVMARATADGANLSYWDFYAGLGDQFFIRRRTTNPSLNAMNITTDGNFGLNVALGASGFNIPSYDLSLGGANGVFNKTIGVERHITTETAGASLTIRAGGSTANGSVSGLSGTPTAAGSGYTAYDILTITTGGTNCTAYVTTVDGSGGVTAVVLRTFGENYTTGTGKATSGGTGTGCTLNITAVRGGTNDNGGNLILSSGISTGSGTSSVLINVYPGTAGSTTDNTPITIATFAPGTITLADATDIVLNATTGTKIGTATTQKLGFFNATPVVQGTAFTQTYSTASHTHANVTASNPPAGGTGTTAGAYDTAANRNAMITSLTNCIADVANVKQVLNGLIDDLQALGLIA